MARRCAAKSGRASGPIATAMVISPTFMETQLPTERQLKNYQKTYSVQGQITSEASAAASDLQLHSIRLERQVIVDGLREVLAGAEVALGGQHRGMAEQELDLLEFAAGGAAELGAGAPGIVRGELRLADPG